MFKKLLSIAAVAAMCFSAKAEIVEDYYCDYSTWDSWNLYEMGYAPTIENGLLVSSNPLDENGDLAWYQYFLTPGFPTTQGTDYTITFMARASAEGTVNIQFGNWGDLSEQQLQLTTTMEEHVLNFTDCATTSSFLVAQPGVLDATVEWAWIKVTHNAKAAQPVQWSDNVLIGCDAEDGQTDCAVAKIWQGSNDSPILPCAIEEVEDGHAFAVHATQKYENPWDNQFWIVTPKTYKKGDILLVSFRYKADKAAKVSSQGHKNPGEYLNGDGVGDLQFGPEWQTVTKQLSIGADGWHSMAFNLSEIEEENTYYFDDIVIREMLLDEGWFVATDLGDLGAALELGWNEADEIYEIYIAEEVETIMISTKRGNDAAFNGNCIKVTEEIEDGEWIGYEVGYQKIALPEAGDWSIQIAPGDGQICFSRGDVTGIMSAINDNNVAPVYYNLQGVQVSNPSNGIFIVKKGNKVTKQVIR